MSDEDALIIAAVDESECLEPVLRRAARLAQCFGGRLVALHVYPARSASLVNDESYGDLALHSAEQRDLQAELQLRNRLESRLAALGVRPGVLELLEGSPAATIAREVETRQAGILVVGRPKARLGSVATKLAKTAACDVHIVRAGD